MALMWQSRSCSVEQFKEISNLMVPRCKCSKIHCVQATLSKCCKKKESKNTLVTCLGHSRLGSAA